MTSEMPLSEALSKSHTGTAPAQPPASVPRSPALSLKTNAATLASTARPTQSDTNSPYLGPAGQAGANGVTDGMRDLALSANEPRYFPGVVTRGHRKDSKRQDSVHEGDEAGKKGRGRGGSVKE